MWNLCSIDNEQGSLWNSGPVGKMTLYFRRVLCGTPEEIVCNMTSICFRRVLFRLRTVGAVLSDAEAEADGGLRDWVSERVDRLLRHIHVLPRRRALPLPAGTPALLSLLLHRGLALCRHLAGQYTITSSHYIGISDFSRSII